MNRTPEKPVVLSGYLQTWKYFQNIPDSTMKKIFTIRPEIKNSVSKYLNGLQAKSTTNKTTFVGLHVRRGDMLTKHRLPRLPKMSYIQKAMVYFQRRYSNVHFVVCSDDPKWCRQHLETVFPNVSVTRDNTWMEDFATLVQCDHVIVTWWTFGWWAAWLNGGDVVYFAAPFIKGDPHNKQFKRNYFPTKWIPMVN